MARRDIRARLERLEKKLGPIDRFAIEPKSAIAVWNDRYRLYDLGSKRDASRNSGEPFTQADEDEAAQLRQRISAACKAFRCPEGYGWREALVDEERDRHYFSNIRTSPPCTEQKKAEAGQAIIRLAAWQNTLEFHHRREIRALRVHQKAYQDSGEFTSWEQARYDELLARYPDAMLEPEDKDECNWVASLKDSMQRGPRREIRPYAGYGKDGPYDLFEALEAHGLPVSEETKLGSL